MKGFGDTKFECVCVLCGCALVALFVCVGLCMSVVDILGEKGGPKGYFGNSFGLKIDRKSMQESTQESMPPKSENHVFWMCKTMQFHHTVVKFKV